MHNALVRTFHNEEIERSTMENIHVLIVGITANPIGPKGGGEMFPLLLAGALLEADPSLQITLMGPDGSESAPGCELITTGPAFGDMVGGKSARRKSAEAISLTGLRAQKWVLQKWRQGEKVVVIDNDLATVCAAGLFNELTVPHWFIQHSFADRDLFAVYARAREMGAKVIAIAQRQIAEAIDILGQAVHDVLIPNGTDISGITLRKREPHDDREIRLAVMGRGDADDKKGWLWSCRVAQRLQHRGYHISLELAGAVDTALEARIRPFIDRGLARCVGLLRTAAEKDVFRQRANIALQLSNPGNWDADVQEFRGQFRECCSLVTLEMQAAGLPTVATDSGGAEPCFPSHRVPLAILADSEDAFVNAVADKVIEVWQQRHAPATVRGWAMTARQMAEAYIVNVIRPEPPIVPLVATSADQAAAAK